MMSVETTITLTSEKDYGRRLPPEFLGIFLENLGPATRQSVQMAFQRRSTSRGKAPDWLERAADFRFLGHDSANGDTVLVFEAPAFGEAAEELYQQLALWPRRPDARDTALDLFADVVADVGSGNKDSEMLDGPLLRRVVRFRRCFDKGFSSATINSPRLAQHPPVLDIGVVESAKQLNHDSPPPRRVRVAGQLDMVRLSTQTFGLKLADGSSIDGVLTAGNIADVVQLLSSPVLVSGQVVYKPSGRPLRLDAVSLEFASDDGSLWETIPGPATGPLPELRRRQTPGTGVGAIIGKWPGDESEEELAEVLEQVS